MMTAKWLVERKEGLAWTACGIGLLVLCFAVTFPYEALHKRLVIELNRATGMDVRVADWTARLPVGIEWRNVTLSPDWGPIQLTLLRAKVQIVKALGGELGVDVIAQLDEASPNWGVASGTLTAASFSLAEPVAIRGQLQQVDLSKIVRRYISHGILNGNFSHRMDVLPAATGRMKGEGTWKAEARDLTVEPIPLGNGRTLSLAFSQVSAGMTCRDIVCDVTELRGDGIDGSFTGEGTITVQQPIQDSRLALTVTVIPGAGFASKAGTLGLPPFPPGTPMTVKVVGTLAEARIAL